MDRSHSLYSVYEGWDGYHSSIVNAVAPLTPEQLAWRPWAQMRSVGELVRHIALGRLGWFVRMDAPHSHELAARIVDWEVDRDGERHIVESAVAIESDAAALVEWLEATWQMVDATLSGWSVDDLATTYAHQWNGQRWAVSRQWTIWRIMAHDIHHGGELALMLGNQGIEAFELQELGGHITLPGAA